MRPAPASKRYDVIVVGGGPAGGQCARRLSQEGFKTLLVERCGSFQENNYSSAGTILGFVEEFQIPPSVIGSYWKSLTIVSSSGTSYRWRSDDALGVVMDFGRLKAFLAGEAARHGADVLMSHRFKSFARKGGRVFASVEDSLSGETSVFEARFLVDGTGTDRAVMRQDGGLQDDYIDMVGIEYLAEVPESCYRPDELVFLLGERWAPRGYAWIFPMERNRLKIGMGQFSRDARGPGPALRLCVDRVISDHLRLPSYKLLDVHGGRIAYSRGQNDRYYADGVLAVGDSISAINPLGGEGIRHGMRSADAAAESIGRSLRSGGADLGSYESSMRGYFGDQWRQSMRIAQVFYQLDWKDSQMDDWLAKASRWSVERLMGVLFHYRFGSYPRLRWRLFLARLLGW